MTTAPPAEHSAPQPGTLAHMIDYWVAERETGTFSSRTVESYLGACARILGRQNIDAHAVVESLDLDALCSGFAAASPQLKLSSLATYTNALYKAVAGYLAHHRPPPTQFDATLGDVPAFLRFAHERGLLAKGTAQNCRYAVRRLLDAQSDWAARPAADLQRTEIAAALARARPDLKASTLASYGYAIHTALHAYTRHLTQATAPRPVRRPRPPVELTEIPLPRERAVSVRAPADLTESEARAAAALLHLSHPLLFTTPAEPAPAPGGWTLVYWPESAPEHPVAAHLTGADFRRALAGYARTRLPAPPPGDEEAIDLWFSTEVFVTLVIDGHHAARDAGALL
jgi:hypothetical protein